MCSPDHKYFFVKLRKQTNKIEFYSHCCFVAAGCCSTVAKLWTPESKQTIQFGKRIRQKKRQTAEVTAASAKSYKFPSCCNKNATHM